ncbi:tetratricopeptide repeat protein [candidate division KSB1 bacterium]
MNENIEKAFIHIENGKFDLAEEEVRYLLSIEPENNLAFSVLAICLANRERFDQAYKEANNAINIAPEEAYSYFALAIVNQLAGKWLDAENALLQAVELDGGNQVYSAFLSEIQGLISGQYMKEEEWDLAMQSAEEGLKNNPENIYCLNIKALLLKRLGKTDEAFSVLETAGAIDPEEPFTKTNLGWTYLEKGDNNRALENFCDALSDDISNESARAGLIEAIKAKNFIYRIMLKYFFWMSRLSDKVKWGIILIGYFAYLFLYNFAESNPQYEPIITPFLIIYIAFVVLTWTADSLFNLMLRLNKYGRMLLSKEEITESNWIGGCILTAIAIYLSGMGTGDGHYSLGAISIGVMIIPISAVYNVTDEGNRKKLKIFTWILAFLGPGTFLLYILDQAAYPAWNYFFIGVFIFTLAANWFIMKD